MMQIITVNTVSGPERCLANVKKGLAIHRNKVAWIITHVPSGTAMNPPPNLRDPHLFLEKADAIAYRDAHIALGDWSKWKSLMSVPPQVLDRAHAIMMAWPRRIALTDMRAQAFDIDLGEERKLLR